MPKGLRKANQVSLEPPDINRRATFFTSSAAEERGISLAADSAKTFVHLQPLKNDARQFLFRLGEFLPDADAFRFGHALLDYFLFPGLYREIGLCKGDGLLAGIAVLGDEVAGISGQADILDFTTGPRPQVDHFAYMRKMVLGFAF